MIDITLEEESLNSSGVNLKVIGVGGAGSNAVNSMINSGEIANAHFIVANTDAQALNLSPAPDRIQLGKKITKGLGAGSNPDIGGRAAQENLDDILDRLANTDILFLTAGLGGGTGSGAIPVIAQAAKELGILTVAVVTKPFTFEGKRRADHAEKALKNLKNAVDTLIVVPNQKLLETADPKISMLNAFALSNEILKHAIKGISDIITKAGHINVDFADVRAIMKDTGIAIMGIGRASGNDRARQAAMRAINSPLLENASIHGAKGVLLNITGNDDLELQEINEAASMIYEMVNPEANIILGSVIDKTIGNDITITVIATGLDESIAQQTQQQPQTQAQKPQLIVENPASVVEQLNKIHDHFETQKPTITIHELRSTNVVKAPEPIAAAHHAISIEDEKFDMNDLDTPTFLRKKAEEQMSSSQDSSSDQL